MTSHIPAKCCTTGTLHEGSPKGKLVTFDSNINAYLATPARNETHRGILYLPDIIGIWQNSKLMADAFAEQGYACLVLDLFNGDPAPLNMPEDFDIMGWITKGTDGKNPHLPENIDPIVVAGIKYMQEVVGAKQLAGVGYCFGAKYLVRHYQDGIKCGFIAHPSFVESQEVAAITGPLSIAAAEHDDIFPPEKRQESETILGETGKPFQINLFSAVEHGFAVRGNVENKSERFAKEQAFQQAVTWFDNWLCE